MEKMMLLAPNFSEYKNREVVDEILDCFRKRDDLYFVNWQGDETYNRFSPSYLGEPEAVIDATVNAIGKGVALIDMRKHKGQHPRMGATDIIPVTPYKGCTMEEAQKVAHEIGRIAAERFDLPIYMFGSCASAPHREKLSEVRKGEFEGLAEKIKDPLWKPDYGPAEMHPTAGATLLTAMDFMVPLDVLLNSTDLDIAKDIARQIRYSSGGYRDVMAIAAKHEDTGLVEVSMDLNDFRKTSVFKVLESVKALAGKYGVTVRSCSMGLVPMEVVCSIARDYLNLTYLNGEDFTVDHIFESHMIK
ncbi:MAG: glutamate formimidoyltransferase [Firmicutes bacterium]|nr:glutamate formimidoyltransferase [Bacillota bacterium]